MSKSHSEQWVVRENIIRAPHDLVAAFRRYPTTQIADSGGPVVVVGPGLDPISGDDEICGSAVTLWTKPGDILFILKAPELIQAGDVLVIDGGGRLDAALIGDIFGGLVKQRGGVGLVVDGAVRDIDGLIATGLPTFARGAYPATGSKEGPGALNVTVQCGGVVVDPGDIVRADASGVVVIPRDSAEEILALTQEVAKREAGWKRDLVAGRSFTEALGLDELIKSDGRGAGVSHLP